MIPSIVLQRTLDHPWIRSKGNVSSWPSTFQTALTVPLQSRLAGITLGDLVPATAGLFDQRRSKALAAMDAIIEKHGTKAIYLSEINGEERL